MAAINTHYMNLAGNYLFAEISRRLSAHLESNPEADLIRLGIGDVTMPLPPVVMEALGRAVEEQGSEKGFRGYGPEQGYRFLREVVCETCYRDLGIDPDAVFISDGAKSDIGNFQELFSPECLVAVTDPVYPVYVDSNIMAGRNILPLPCTDETNFIPAPPRRRPDLIYLCFPNNPTGACLSREQLADWVRYARENGSVILFDAAYEAFIRDPAVPHSIYEIDGARNVAVEFRSYSKTAGFTGLRCGFTVVPDEVAGRTPSGESIPLRQLWLRRQTTKFNGCPYIVQRAAAATHTPEGMRQLAVNITMYLENARLIRSALEDIGLKVSGGDNSPYVWATLPAGMDSWKFFDRLLHEAAIVGTPGVGFGACGEGHFRFTGFGKPERAREAAERLRRLAL